MASKKTWDTVTAIYDNVHIALWALLISFLGYFAIAVVPNMRAAQGEAQRHRMRQIAAEHEFYCNKWGMGAHTQAHDQCIFDLRAFRAHVEQRIYDESELW